MEKKYFVAKSLMFANALTYLSGQMPLVFDNKFEKDKKVWSFIRDEKLQYALNILHSAKEDIEKIK